MVSDMAKNITDEQIINLYNQGLSDNKIAKKLGCYQSYISLRRRNLNLEPNYKRFDNSKKASDEEIIQLHEEGLNDAEIAIRLGYKSSSPIRRRRNRLNLKPNWYPKGKKDIPYEKIRELHSKGFNDRQIAEKLECSENTIYRKRHELNLKPVSNKRVPDEIIISLHSQGLNDKEIGDKVGYHKTSVQDRRHKIGLEANWKRYNVSDDEIRKAYEQGSNDREMGELCGLKKCTFGNRRNKLGLEPKGKHRRFTRYPDEEISRLYGDGCTIKEISDKLEINGNVVRQRLSINPSFLNDEQLREASELLDLVEIEKMEVSR